MVDSEKRLTNALGKLENTRLTAVNRVEDYLQFCFGNATLTSYTLPIVVLRKRPYFKDDPEYGPVLQQVVGSNVRKAEYIQSVVLSIRFNEAEVQIPLREADYSGPEAFELSDSDGTIYIV
jgi:hypothetical protein